MNTSEQQFTTVERLGKDILAAMRKPTAIGESEARYLVDGYYTMQDARIRVSNQISALNRDAKREVTEPEPHSVLDWIFQQNLTLERETEKVLGAWVEGHEMAWFFAATLGIGPVLSAGLLAHIDVERAPTAGHIWSFAGLANKQWNRGEKRPWNPHLKTICWKVSRSFVMLSGRPDCFYGQHYRQRKLYEESRNDAGLLAEQAAAKLKTVNIGKDKAAFAIYSQGKLPPAHIDARARRETVKLFLSHLHECWYLERFGEAPPKPFAISQLGHGHYIRPPQLPS